MGVTRRNLKTIMKGLGRYHEMRWNVYFLAIVNEFVYHGEIMYTA